MQGQEANHLPRVRSIPVAVMSAVAAIKQATANPATALHEDFNTPKSASKDTLLKAGVTQMHAASSAAANVDGGSATQRSSGADEGLGSDAAGGDNRAERVGPQWLQTKIGLSELQRSLRLDVGDTDRLTAAYRKVLDAFRTGKLGRLTLDDVV